jgi:hypothetical protein
MNDSASDVVPEYLANDVRAIRAAYPQGVPQEEYEPLLYVLCESMSMRNVAHTLELCGIRDYSGAYNDIQGIAYNHAQYAEAAKPVLERLMRHGFVPDAD